MKAVAIGLMAAISMLTFAASASSAAGKKAEPQWIKQFWEEQTRRGGY